MATPSTDAADEAGGEAIYASDGLPPLPAPRAPFIENITTTAGIGAELDSLEVPSTMFVSIPESALERITRLQREIASLTTTTASSQELATMVEELQNKLDAATKLSPCDDLAALMAQHVSKQQQDTTKQQNLQDGLVYELYGGSTDVPSSMLEERLMKLEQLMVGNSLLQRLQVMEEKVKQVDAKSLEDASLKAKVIRADLEAAAKAKSKLGMASTNDASSRAIFELHQELQHLEGLSAHLPLVAHRLQQLSHLHVQSSTTTARLSGAEQDILTLNGSLFSMKQTLETLERGMMDHTKIMEQNVKAMEERIKQL